MGIYCRVASVPWTGCGGSMITYFRGKTRDEVDSWVQARLGETDKHVYCKLGYLRGYSGYEGLLHGYFDEQYEELIKILQ